MMASSASDPGGLPRRRPRGAFLAARGGASAVEFAILSPIFFAALFMMIQVSMILLQQHLLDSATSNAVRGLILGKVQSAGTRTADDFKRNYLCPELIGLFDCGRLIADIRVTRDGAPNFDASWVDMPVTDQGTASFCVGAAGEYMYMRVAYPMPLLGIGLYPDEAFPTFEGAKVAMLQSYGALRVEPVAAQRTGTC